MNPISNHQGQKDIWFDPNRFKVAVAGRRFGKTYLQRQKLLQCTQVKKGLFWYVAPTRLHAKDLMWDDLKEDFDQRGWAYEKDETALAIIRKKTKCKIVLKSGEKYDRLRGKGLNGALLDEAADLKKQVWTEAIRASLSDKLGWAWFFGTPKGFNWFHDLYQDAKVRDQWSAFQFKTLDSPFFQTEEGRREIEDARQDLDERTFKQEYEASFESFNGRICYAFDRNVNHTDYVYKKEIGSIIVGMDFNVLPMSACLFQRVGGKLIQFDEMSLNTSNTEELCQAIKDKYQGVRIIVRPDASGASRAASSKKTSFEIIRQFGFKIEADLSNPRRPDRWATQNRAFERQLVLINTIACPKTTKDLETLCYKEGICEPDLKGKLHGHLFDANGYAIFREYPIRAHRQKATSTRR